MKALVLAAFALALSGPALAQTSHAPAKTPKSNELPRLGDSFAKAGLLAMKAIQSDATQGQFRSGQLLVNRRVSEAIDAMDVEGTSVYEKLFSVKMTSLQIAKETNNVNRQTIASLETAKAYSEGSPRDDVTISERVAKAPEFLRMEQAESRCFAELDAVFRERSTEFPKSCDVLDPKEDAGHNK